MIYRLYIILLFFIQFILAQFPTNLSPDEISDPLLYQSTQDSEFILSIIASTNTNWSLYGSESATLTIAIDGDWENYNQDIILYAGNTSHEYNVSLGYLEQGEHSIEFKFDYNKSTIGAEHIHIESVDIVDIESLDIDSDVLLHSPILYGRDLLSWNESTHTDIPLIMFYDLSINNSDFTEYYKKITYSFIFSNEDSRVGIGLSDLMFNYGRTTDIEWIYEVTLDEQGNIISEIFQGPSHTTTDFSGQKINKHPILKNATLNCNFTDVGTSDYKFFLSPIIDYGDYYPVFNTREIIMDEYPWTYRIMGEELINENRYEIEANPSTIDISDVRNYIYVQYFAEPLGGSNITLDLAINLYGGCEQYFHNHNSELLSSNFYGGVKRTSIELPVNFDPIQIESLDLISSGNSNYIIDGNISRFFYLNDDYIPIDIPINTSNFSLSSDNSIFSIDVYENFMNMDCFGTENGNAECDDCNVCNGNNLDIDDCGVCFGNNINMDCNGDCFGVSTIDDCGVCDNDLENNNLTCSGCTDINAENYDENAIFYDESCLYNDNLFFVPIEYNNIQDAIFYSGNGDTVEIGSGTYYENIALLNKSITLMSNPSIDNQPIIMGVDSMSTIIVENSLDASIQGITVSNGYGQGVSFDDFLSLAADPTAFDSLLTEVLRGGGLSIINSDVYLKDLNITNNTSRNVGAGIGLINSSVILESSSITNNTIPDGDALGGGGIAINGGDVSIIDTHISDNIVGSNLYSLNGGGGILCGFSFGEDPLSLSMYNTTILSNEANVGAGIGALSGEIHLERVKIINNSGDYGAAISMGEPLGLIVSDISMNVINSTISNNSGLLTTGLINSAYLNILNSIFWENNSDYEFASMPNNDQLNIEAHYSIFENELFGEGNLFINPLFDVDSYELSPNSPAIDSGTDYFNFDNESINIESYYGDAPDIGAHEFQGCTNNPSGDINTDGILDILDILQTVNIIMGFSDIIDNQFCFVDMNQDNILDIFDIIIMINSILNQ